MMIQDINMVGRERLAFLYGLYSSCAESESELNAKGIYWWLLFRLVDCTGAGQHRNEDEEVRA